MNGEQLTQGPTMEELKTALDECEKVKNDYLTGWQRERADFINYKKEEVERFEKVIEYVTESFSLKILPILDSFYLAEKNLPDNLKNDENIKGLLQIKAQIGDFLKAQGIEEIEAAGRKFDPIYHEVVEEIEAPSGHESGIVIEETQKGYLINEKVLRPAKVKVSR